MSKDEITLVRKVADECKCGMMDARYALRQAEWDVDKAIEWLRKNPPAKGI